MPKVGFSSHPHENKHITSKRAHLTYRNKELTYSSFLQFCQYKEVTSPKLCRSTLRDAPQASPATHLTLSAQECNPGSPKVATVKKQANGPRPEGFGFGVDKRWKLLCFFLRLIDPKVIAGCDDPLLVVDVLAICPESSCLVYPLHAPGAASGQRFGRDRPERPIAGRLPSEL